MQFQFIRKLLNLKDVTVEDIRYLSSHAEIHISMPIVPHSCPYCNTTTQKIHDYRIQPVKDIPLFNQPLRLIYRKRRYKCTSCNKRFYEFVNFVGRYQRMSKRLIEAVVHQLRNNYSMKSVAQFYGLVPCTVARIFDYVCYQLNQLPEVLSIDEFKGTTDKGKYHCILVDPIHSQVLDILGSRSLDYLINYFRAFKDRSKVKYVVIDMWKPYKIAVQQLFPKATIVIDRFHYVRNCIWAIDKVRKRIQKSLVYEKGKFLKNSRKLLLTRPYKLTDESKTKLANILISNEEIRLSYVLKERFMEFVESETYEDAAVKLSNWLELVREYQIKEFSYLANTVIKWKDEILNSFIVPYNNGCVEGFNNKIKVIKRNAFGFRKFSRFRSRILHCCT